MNTKNPDVLATAHLQVGTLTGCVLSIPSGTSQDDVLMQASCHLSAAMDVLKGLAMASEDGSLWGVYYALEMGKALTEAANALTPQEAA